MTSRYSKPLFTSAAVFNAPASGDSVYTVRSWRYYQRTQ